MPFIIVTGLRGLAQQGPDNFFHLLTGAQQIRSEGDGTMDELCIGILFLKGFEFFPVVFKNKIDIRVVVHVDITVFHQCNIGMGRGRLIQDLLKNTRLRL